MGTFDLVLNELETKFGISRHKASTLLSSLLSVINEQTDGVRGFFDRFERAGLRGWLFSSKDTKPIDVEKLQSTVGREALDKIASRSGLSLAAATSAVGFILPKIFQRIAPGGAVPSRLPSEMTPYMAGSVGTVGSVVHQAAYPAERIVVEKPTQGQYAWVPVSLLLLGSLIGGWLWMSRRPAESIALPVTEQPALAREATATLPAAPNNINEDFVRSLNLNVVHFASGSAQITQESYDSLNRAAVAIKSAPTGTKLQIVGHTDSKGDEAANLSLSRQRATVVRDYLIQQGVNPEELVAAGNGQTEPAATNETEEGRFRNRRIEFSALP